jgi:hypothetical protein
MDQLIQFLNTSEGRDKSGKVVQYASRFIFWQNQGVNEIISQSFKNLYGKFSKVFSLTVILIV